MQDPLRKLTIEALIDYCCKLDLEMYDKYENQRRSTLCFGLNDIGKEFTLWSHMSGNGSYTTTESYTVIAVEVDTGQATFVSSDFIEEYIKEVTNNYQVITDGLLELGYLDGWQASSNLIFEWRHLVGYITNIKTLLKKWG